MANDATCRTCMKEDETAYHAQHLWRKDNVSLGSPHCGPKNIAQAPVDCILESIANARLPE